MVVVLAAPITLFGCGGGGESNGAAHLTWYINPDNGGQATLAKQCSEQSEGAFTISTQVLPTEADAQREQLVRRLAAKDSSIDLMSLDPCLLYTSPSPRDGLLSRMPSSA